MWINFNYLFEWEITQSTSTNNLTNNQENVQVGIYGKNMVGHCRLRKTINPLKTVEAAKLDISMHILLNHYIWTNSSALTILAFAECMYEIFEIFIHIEQPSSTAKNLIVIFFKGLKGKQALCYILWYIIRFFVFNI